MNEVVINSIVQAIIRGKQARLAALEACGDNQGAYVQQAEITALLTWLDEANS